MSFRVFRPNCARCHTPLAKRGGQQWFQCGTCDGQFLSLAELQQIFSQAQPDRELAIVTHNDGSPRMPCLVCTELMDVAWVEFLRLLRCQDHGCWFEPGQLERLLVFDVTPEAIPNFRSPKYNKDKGSK